MPALSFHHRLRRLVRPVLVSAAVLLTLLLCLRFVAVPLLVLLHPPLDLWFYDHSVYGLYPQQYYHSFHIASPAARRPRWNHVCAEESRNGLVLLDLHGSQVKDSGPVVLDLAGNLIWTNASFGGENPHAMNAKVQEYKEEQYLTFWAGDDYDHGHCYMLDNEFNLAYNVSAVGDRLWADPHECKITSDNTALLIAYNHTSADTSNTNVADLGPYIVDAIIQEVDVESGELLFQWRASDHFADDNEYLKTSYDAPFARHSKKYRDYFHMNSVDKLANGDLLVSIRHTHSFMRIEKDTGDILWAFGGTSTDFKDLSNGEADFKWQHDARWIDEGRGLLGLFDNALSENSWYDAPYSLGKIIHLDTENRTAELVHSYHSLEKAKSTSQGSFQFIPSRGSEEQDQVFIGWGSVPAFTIHDAKTEELLCETHYAPSLFQYYEFAKSYRTVRAPREWTATPAAWDPNAVAEGGRVYVSWNGGMTVRWWVLQRIHRHARGDELRDEDWEDVETVERDGFETAFELAAGGNTLYRIAALDASKNTIRFSNTFWNPGSWFRIPSWVSFSLGVGVVLLMFAGAMRWRQVMFWIKGRRRGIGLYTQIPNEEAWENHDQDDAASLATLGRR
ncbi:uncharacterized protein LTR77_011183 [Saxophila tyrrhenica]|uniref:ASST-domain-containing protein n=1 Tax=Saxophila tyrrhenica TaxID=1690608 RepID=A0AAV9NTV5_9PEZI|nr:hypothetical protein LTR77_011183 [Saxophila tyrrhenica]